MDVVSSCALPVASLVWQPRPGAWVLTVVCKATYVLRPVECTLAPLQEHPADEDRHWDDDPARSLRCPRDLVPVKPGADVILVGSAFAPHRRHARAVDVRLSVGDIAKSIEAVADRTVRPDGSVREGQPFIQMPLVYERAGGGPGTSNPVGMRRELRDADGGMVLPNLQRPGASLQNVFEPVGFGPIAPSWPERRDRLGTAGASWAYRELGQRPLPEGMDLAFFNTAPRDQQVRAFGERLRIALDNLHPEYPQLITSLSTSPPRALLEGRREGAVAVTLRADTLWIDTDRGVCTLTFRGMVPLHSADEMGRVVVSTESDRPSGEIGTSARIADEPSGVFRSRPPRNPLGATLDAPTGILGAALPFGPSPPASAVAPIVMLPPVPEPAIFTPPAAPVPSSPWAVGGHAAEAAAFVAPLVVARAVAPVVSLLEVSTAAVGEPRLARHVDPVPAAAVMEPPPAVRAEGLEAIDLVWFDPESVPRIRRKAAWRPILEALERAPIDPDFDDPAFAKDPMLIEDRREVFEVVARAAPTSAEGLDAALARCLRDDGKFIPVLALFVGEMELPFDELATLRATLTTVSPLVGSDESLKSAVQTARDFLATPGLMSAPAVAEGLTKRMEDAFAQGKRVVPAGYLEAQRERALLEQRQYQRRSVFGGKHVRGLLRMGGAEPTGPRLGVAGKSSPAGGTTVVPAYLPESLVEGLPMYPRFRVRMVAEIRLAADRYETHPAALRVLALARVAPPSKG